MVHGRYNTSDLNKRGADYMSPGMKAEFPQNLFNTWLDYKESQGFNRAEVIRTVNDKVDRKYNNDRFYRWKKQRATVAELVIINFVYPDLPAVLEWFFKDQGYPVKGIDFDHLAGAVRPPIKLTQGNDDDPDNNED
jgi:hypothetical protein